MMKSFSSATRLFKSRGSTRHLCNRAWASAKRRRRHSQVAKGMALIVPEVLARQLESVWEDGDLLAIQGGEMARGVARGLSRVGLVESMPNWLPREGCHFLGGEAPDAALRGRPCTGCQRGKGAPLFETKVETP
jgi:hypothetical protein